jgi:hypothetical protein
MDTVNSRSSNGFTVVPFRASKRNSPRGAQWANTRRYSVPLLYLLLTFVLASKECDAAIHGFIYNGTSYITLDYPNAFPNIGTRATGIWQNTVVGWYGDGSHNHGFIFNGSTYTKLDDPLGTNTYLRAISGNKITGYYTDSAGLDHGFIYDGASFTTLNNPLTTGATYPQGIYANTTVGQYNSLGGTHPGINGYMFNGTAWTTINDPLGVDSSGVADCALTGMRGNDLVGWFHDGVAGYQRGFVYDGSIYTTLNDPLATHGTNPSAADSTNIVGTYTDAIGPHGFLYNGTTWMTIDDPLADPHLGSTADGIYGSTIVGSFTTTPEPNSLILIFTCAFGLRRRLRR